MINIVGENIMSNNSHIESIPYREQRVKYPGAAEITKYKESTLRVFVMKNQIPHEKHNRSIFFKVGDLLDWMNSKKVEGGF